jgi:hypothetical protein
MCGEAASGSRFEIAEEERQFDAEALAGTILHLVDLERLAESGGFGGDRYGR